MKSKILALLGGTLLSGMAMAGGYQVNLASQRQIGMGHTGTGLVTGTSSIFFNPGAMSHLGYNGVTIGASGLISKIAYRAPEPSNAEYRTDNDLGTPFQFYGVFGGQASPFKFGLGVYTPYGSGVKWGEEWQGRFGLSQIDLSAIYIQPTASYKINDKLGIGAGVVYAVGGVNLQRMIPLEDQQGSEGRSELDGNAGGVGFNAGIYFKPTDKLSVGLTYRSKIDMEVEGGTAEFTVPASVGSLDPSRFPNTKFDATLPLPENITLGIGFKPTEALTLALDVQRVGWSAYDSLIFKFEDEVNKSKTSGNARNYKDTYIYRLGAEYQISGAFAVRAGGYLDKTPVKSGYLTPESPDADAIGFSAGLSYNISSNFAVDASFLYINKKERTDTAVNSGGVPGTFKAVAYIPGIALSYNF